MSRTHKAQKLSHTFPRKLHVAKGAEKKESRWLATGLEHGVGLNSARWFQAWILLKKEKKKIVHYVLLGGGLHFACFKKIALEDSMSLNCIFWTYYVWAPGPGLANWTSLGLVLYPFLVVVTWTIHKLGSETGLVLSVNPLRPFATRWTVACQAPLSAEFSRQEYWSG